MSKQEAAAKQSRTTTGNERVNLDRQYGRIGISSVAAALPFVGNAKNASHSLVPRDDEQRHGERRPSVLAI